MFSKAICFKMLDDANANSTHEKLLTKGTQAKCHKYLHKYASNSVHLDKHLSKTQSTVKLNNCKPYNAASYRPGALEHVIW